MFCRQCGRAGTLWRHDDPIDPAALRSDLRRTPLPQGVVTPPQAAAGFVWAMGEAGDLYRLNPYAAPGEQMEVHDRFWAEAQPHAFYVGRLRAFPAKATAGERQWAEEDCAVVVTADRLLISGLFRKQRRSVAALPAESFLVHSAEELQFVAAHGSSVLLLSRYAEQVNLCHFDLATGEAQRFSVASGGTAVCGPALLFEAGSAHAVLWSRTALWVYTEGTLLPVTLPEAVELPTAAADGGLRLAAGRSSAMAGDGWLFLPAQQYGRPALLRLARDSAGWATTVVAVVEEGTLGVSTTGEPLLSTADRVLACTGPAFRTLVKDAQIASRFPAWAHAGLVLFLCEVDYRGLKQWLKAYAEGAEVPVAWDLPPGAAVQAINGFFATGTALSSVCVVAEQGLRTEFLSWCV